MNCIVCKKESTTDYLGQRVCDQHNYYPPYKLVELEEWKSYAANKRKENENNRQ